MPVVDIKGVGKAQFPDGMSVDNIREFLRKKYSQGAISGASRALEPMPDTVSAYEPTLTERMGQGVADALYDTGIISDRYGAQRIGGNIATLGEFLPGIGDATAGDEFGKAAAEGDKTGMLLAGIGAVPVVGDALKQGVKGLYKVHNITEGGLKKADEFGGIPVPSLAIAGKDTGFESFGDISLIGDKGSFLKDPTFASDVYSPRFPQSKDKIDVKAARAEAERLSGIVDPKIDSGFDSQFYPDRLSDDIGRLETSTGNRAAFLRGIGEDIDSSKYTSAAESYDIPKWFNDAGFSKVKSPTLKSFESERFSDSANRFMADMDPDRTIANWYDGDGLSREGKIMILKGVREVQQKSRVAAAGPKFDRYKAQTDIDKKITQNQEKFDSYISDQKSRISKGKVFTKWNPEKGTSKEFEFNLKNAVKLMKGNIRGGEGFSYGVGNIRAEVAPKLTSMKQIQDRRGQIVGEDQMTMVKEGFNSRLDNLYDSLSKNWAWASDPSYSDFADGITNAAKGDFGDFKGLNREQKGELKGFFDELANAPTNYFEIKPQRAVNINEFYGAAVPEGTSKSVIDGLKAQGLKIETYKPEQRKEAIKKLNVKSGGQIFFSGAGAAMLYGVTKEDNNTN